MLLTHSVFLLFLLFPLGLLFPLISLLCFLCICVFSSVFVFFLWFVWLHFLFFFFTFISALFFEYAQNSLLEKDQRNGTQGNLSFIHSLLQLQGFKMKMSTERTELFILSQTGQLTRSESSHTLFNVLCIVSCCEQLDKIVWRESKVWKECFFRKIKKAGQSILNRTTTRQMKGRTEKSNPFFSEKVLKKHSGCLPLFSLDGLSVHCLLFFPSIFDPQ